MHRHPNPTNSQPETYNQKNKRQNPDLGNTETQSLNLSTAIDQTQSINLLQKLLKSLPRRFDMIQELRTPETE